MNTLGTFTCYIFSFPEIEYFNSVIRRENIEIFLWKFNFSTKKSLLTNNCKDFCTPVQILKSIALKMSNFLKSLWNELLLSLWHCHLHIYFRKCWWAVALPVFLKSILGEELVSLCFDFVVAALILKFSIYC